MAAINVAHLRAGTIGHGLIFARQSWMSRSSARIPHFMGVSCKDQLCFPTPVR